MQRLSRLGGLIGVVLAGVTGPARADALSDWVELLYRPFQTEQITLSPDGRHLAYTQHAKGETSLVLMPIDRPAAKKKIIVAGDRAVQFERERAAAGLRYLHWVSADRLVFAPTEDTTGAKIMAEIFATDAAATDVKSIADMNTFADVSVTPMGSTEEDPTSSRAPRRFRIVGPLAGDPEHILVEAQGRRPPTEYPPGWPPTPVPFTLFKIDVRTGKATQLAEEYEFGEYLYDWQGRPRIRRDEPARTAQRSFQYLGPNRRDRWETMDQLAAGSGASFTLSPANYFGARAWPLGFDFDGKTLYFASNAGRDTFGVYALNVETRQRTKFAAEHPTVDLVPLEGPSPVTSTLVFDEHRQRLAGIRAFGVTPFTLWIDPELAAVQRGLGKKFPRHAVEMLEWDAPRRRFLVRLTSLTEPGRHYLYDRGEGRLLELLQRAPWLENAPLHETLPFELKTAAGVQLTGYLTMPRAPRLTPPPLVVCFANGFPPRVSFDFDREAQVLAEMGLAVVRVNHRGTAGFGARHRDAIQAGIDRVAVDDVLATIDWLARQGKINPKRVATMGEGFGGFLALRATQLAPAAFRCAVSISAPLDLERWLRPRLEEFDAPPEVDFAQEVRRAYFQRAAGPLRDISVLRQAATLIRPVCLMVDPQGDIEINVETSALRAELHRLGRAPENIDIDPAFSSGLPAARARVYHQLGEFFNLTLYNYKAEIGEAKEVK